ncbi:hypothetical protein I3843_10G020600 [Carya illinoinensis]|nr:hypothetical protein I3843_10G020600 [Carya illinoinensis]
MAIPCITPRFKANYKKHFEKPDIPTIPELMAATTLILHFISFLSLHYLVGTTLFLSFIPMLIHSSTLHSDIEVLRTVKHSVDSRSISSDSFLDTWDFRVDPCGSTGRHFLGVLCSIPLDHSPSRIIAIDLDDVGYDGFLTPSIGNLTELTILNLSKNKFRRTIPESISNLTKLTKLSLADNCLAGTIPTEITLLKNLEYLDMSGNTLSGSIPTNISRLRNLSYLRMARNALTGTIPDLTGLWQLETLDLSYNQLYGNLPYFPLRLTTLSLNDNILTGHISPVNMLSNLSRLDLSHNLLSGIIGKEILSFPRLVYLNVSNNQFNAIEAANFSMEERQLHFLDAENNNLHGLLPVNLTTIQNLTAINLSRNEFAGPIPREFGNKIEQSWRILYLDNNFLSGDLPTEFITHSKRITGSLANNCLKCPVHIKLCRGGQRPASECIR